MERYRVAVCVIAYNEAQNIENLLQQIVDERLKSSSIFIDSSGSTDGTSNLVSSFESRYPRLVTHIRGDKRKGKHVAYNELLERVQGYKYCVFLDGDVCLSKRSVHRLVRYLINHPQYKVAGSFLLPELVKGSLVPQVYRKVKEHIYQTGKHVYFTGRAFIGRTKYLSFIPESSFTDDFFLNLKFATNEISICRRSAVKYVIPYTASGMFWHSYHIGNTISDLKDNFPDLWEEQVKRVPLFNYVVFGLTQNNFWKFWGKLSFSEKITFIYSRKVTIMGFLSGFLSPRRRQIWEPIRETKKSFA